MLSSSIADVFEGSGEDIEGHAGASALSAGPRWTLGAVKAPWGVQQALPLPRMDMRATPATRFFGPFL